MTPPTLQVIRPDGSPAAGASVLLQRGGRLIDQGVTALDGTITVLGAAPGDLVTFEVLPPLLGAADAAQASTFGVRYIAREAVVCPTSLLPAAGEPDRQMAPATVVVQPTTYDVRVQIAPADPSDPQRAALRVQASTTLAAPPTVTWMQIGADGSSHPGLSYDSAAQTYVGTLQLAPAAPVQGVLLVDAVDNQQRKVHTAVNLHLELATTTVDQRIISGDGQAELSIPANSLRGEGQIGLAVAVGRCADACRA